MTSFENVRASWSASETELGYAAGKPIATQLADSGHIPGGDVSAAGRYIDHYPMKKFVYDGAKEAVEGLLSKGACVTFWTQGDPKHQLYKVASSGLLDLRRENPDWKSRLKAFADIDKVAELEHFLPSIITENTRRIVFVDDKAKNIRGIAEEVARLRAEGTLSQDLEITPIWINQGRTKNQVPEGYSLDGFKSEFTTIEDIRELQEKVVGEEAGTHFLLDWDHTLANTGEWRCDVQESLSRIYARRPIVDRYKDEKLGLHEAQVHNVYSTGMSGSSVICVEKPQGKTVIKHGGVNNEKILREVDGYRALLESPLAEHMLPVGTEHMHHGVLHVEHFDGVQMREAIKTGGLSPELAASVFAQLLEIKAQWWSGQQKMPETSRNSMQRQEWEDTLSRLHQQTLPALVAAGYDWQRGMSMIVNGREQYIDICQIISDSNRFLSSKSEVGYSVVGHNDATGANILVDPNSGDWRIFDYEWAGLNDPAESFARMIKYTTTATVRTFNLGRSSEPTVLSYELSDAAISLQQIGLSYASTIAEGLQDEQFDNRVKSYLIGSYVREAALASERGGIPAALFALTQAANISEPAAL